MPRGGAQFSSEELIRVLSHYDVGVILKAESLSGGNRRAPKMVIESEQGKFLLKRRPKGKDDLYRVVFAHAVQNHLASKGFPVTSLISTRDENNTILQLNNHIYEFFRFIEGSRYDSSAESTVDTGRRLAEFHRHLSRFAHEWKPLQTSFHDSSTVRAHLKTVGSDRMAGPKRKMQSTAEALMVFYNQASISVNESGFDSWPNQVVHGDWHPGNMLFSERKVAAVLDFDSIKFAPPLTDLANAMLQFSIVGGRPNPAEWPDYFDADKLIQVLNGYRRKIKISADQTNALLDLMIETMIAEAVLPIAATGFFGHHSGLDFLQMIRRKAEWLDRNRKKIAKMTALE